MLDSRNRGGAVEMPPSRRQLQRAAVTVVCRCGGPTSGARLMQLSFWRDISPSPASCSASMAWKPGVFALGTASGGSMDRSGGRPGACACAARGDGLTGRGDARCAPCHPVHQPRPGCGAIGRPRSPAGHAVRRRHGGTDLLQEEKLSRGSHVLGVELFGAARGFTGCRSRVLSLSGEIRRGSLR